MENDDLSYFLIPDSNSPEIPLLTEKEYLIGRSPGCSILLSDQAVSREHARLVFSGATFEIRDLQSTNGTMVNGDKVTARSLDSMDRLTFGRIAFTFKIRRSSAQGNRTLPPGNPELMERELNGIIEEMDQPHLKTRLRDLSEKLSRAGQSLMELAYGDDLTGLYNRRFFDKALDTEFRRAVRYGRPLTLIMIDIDHFKLFNDRYGHQKGDSVLRTVGAILRENCRSSDMVCRYGGEEMAVILPEQSLEQGVRTAEKLRTILGNQSEEIEGVAVTASFGVGTALKSDRSAGDLVKRSDQALYKAKKEGRNRTATI